MELHFLVLAVLGAVALCGRADKTCEELGFTGLALCSDCDAFAEIVKDQELELDCRKCCAEENEESLSKLTFSGARLEVCMRKLMFYPHVQTFIESKLEKFPAVQAQYRFNASPKLILLDEDGNEKETVRIDNWKTEHIEQFLEQKVKPKHTEI
ncbi:hypothetical protein SELMODRAFT_440387 [Selaginella moellendorffii]|uniref:Selenoprotein F n=1 Tax=Selaginella moellendorffii TaxID=88036 RepID=D8RBF7_SELML|nr:selenoprotein F [Selaginella moellendorffii]EFJ30489.1 hypothetical protein SELMODRAFT_440387 [Selaginella moellendorffii]|eukprot:XP_002968235.1 selenoprotein F [Selaginella moellendorffii]